MTSKILVIIVHYSGMSDTLDCLDSLEKAVFNSNEIVLVNNNSSDFNKSKALAKFSKLKIINSKKNLGFSGGNNLGINYGLKNYYKHFVLLNNDTILPKSFKSDLKKALTVLPKNCLFSPKIYFAKGYEFHKDRYKNDDLGKVIWYAGGLIDWENVYASHRGVNEVDSKKFNKQIKTGFATGCCMVFPRMAVKKIGLFDDKYFLYFEDLDFCERARRKGIDIYYQPDLYLWHKNASSSEGAGGKTSYYYQTRNRFIFAFKYASIKTRLHLLVQAISFIFKKDKTKQKASMDFLFLKRGART